MLSNHSLAEPVVVVGVVVSFDAPGAIELLAAIAEEESVATVVDAIEVASDDGAGDVVDAV